MRAWFSPLPLPVGEKKGEISLPKISLEDLLSISGSLKEAGKQLRKLSVAEIAKKLDFVARQWSNPDLPERKKAISLLPKFLPFSEPACRQAIDNLFEPLTVNHMLKLLDELLGDHRSLDKFVEYPSGLKRKAFGANLVFLVLSGNIVSVGIWDIIFCLLCKTPVLVKPSSVEPILPPLFAQSLERFAPELASAVAVVPFESERKELIDAVIKECDVVIAYGTDETIQSVKQKTPPKVKFIERGHKFSIAIVADEFTDGRTADLLAFDIARFEQRGCLSPQVCFVVGQNAQRRGKEFAQKIATAFRRLDKEVPTNLGEGKRVSVVQFRLACEMMGANVLASEDASWTVVEWSEISLYGWQKVSCAARTLHIVTVESLDKVIGLLQPLGKFLQGVAVAMEPGEAKHVAGVVGQMGASRVCPVGQLQVPPIEWSQDGRHLISELVRWCDFEPIPSVPKESGWVEFYRGDWEKAAVVWQTLEQMGIPVKPETQFDPTDPTSPIFVICIPAQHLSEAEQVMASKHSPSHET